MAFMHLVPTLIRSFDQEVIGLVQCVGVVCVVANYVSVSLGHVLLVIKYSTSPFSFFKVYNVLHD